MKLTRLGFNIFENSFLFCVRIRTVFISVTVKDDLIASALAKHFLNSSREISFHLEREDVASVDEAIDATNATSKSISSGANASRSGGMSISASASLLVFGLFSSVHFDQYISLPRSFQTRHLPVYISKCQALLVCQSGSHH